MVLAGILFKVSPKSLYWNNRVLNIVSEEGTFTFKKKNKT